MQESPLTPIAQQVCEKRYFKKDDNGKIIEDWGQLVDRVVNHVCRDEDDEFKSQIYDLMYKTEFLPNSPCLVNAGRGTKSPGLLACFVTKPPEDSWIGMIDNIANYGHVCRVGGGCGVDFSNIRPEGDPVFGSTHAKACGPIEHMRMVSEVMHSITQSGFRSMACCSYDTMISTEQGFVQLGEIVEHNMIGLGIHTQFGPAIITDAWCNGEKEIFELITEKGNKIKLTGDHKVYVINKYNGKNHGKLSKKINKVGVWKEVRDLNLQTDCLVLNLDKKPFATEYQYVEGIKLDEKLSSLISYTKCDGHFKRYNKCQRLELSLDSEESVDHFMNSELVDFNQYYRPEHNITVLRKEGKSVEFMKHFGEFGTYHCDIPIAIFKSPKSVIAAFLRASFDAEGTVSVDEGRCEIITGMTSIEYVEGLQILLGMFGIQSQLRRDVVHVNKDGILRQNMHYLRISNKWHIRRFMKEIGFLSRRKNRAAQKALGRMNFKGDGRGNSPSSKIIHRIKSIESLGEMKVYDISTSNETFLANNLVVHNCMSCLRIDHPDIFKFIKCKQRDNAFKSLLKEDIFNHYDQFKDSLDDQLKIVLDKFISNFNISVFATDDFMQKVEDDKEYDLVFDGKVYQTVKARDVFNAIVENAWKNGDPGMLFHNAINDGPYKYSGQKITASNPCGEQILPEFGSCNLSSIDVSKFYNEDREVMEWTRLGIAIKNVIQFLDNVIDVNKFPTNNFAKWAKENRPVGLGIMGWADLLLKMQITYGSEESIKFAKKIGRFFEKTSHEKSVALGKERGTPKSCRYEELEHRRNVTTLSIAPTGTISLLAGCSSSIEPVFSAVTYRYDNTGSREMKHKYSNKSWFKCSSDLNWEEHVQMQAAFQPHIDSAISKCVTGNSLVLTNNGLQRLEDLSNNREEDSFSPLSIEVSNGERKDPWRKTKDFYYGGKKRTIKIGTKNGFVIEGTPNHKIKVFNPDGKIQFKRLDELQLGYYCPIPFNSQKFGNIVDLSTMNQSKYKHAKHLKIPDHLDADLSYLLGIISAEGSYQANDSVVVTHCDKEILKELDNIFKSEFGIGGTISLDKRTESVHKLVVNSRNLVKWMQEVADIRRGAGNKVIPSIILNSTQDNIASFLGGLFFDGYLTQNNYHGTKFGLCLDSESIIRDLQIVFANMGIISNIIKKHNKEYDKYFHEILVYGDSLFKLRDLITFREAHKQNMLTNINTVKPNNYHLGLPKFVTDMVSEAVANSSVSMNSFIDETHNYRIKNAVYRNSSMKREDVENAFEYFGYGKDNTYTYFRNTQTMKTISETSNWIYQEIVSIEESEAEVFDIYVPDGNTFVANGFINHNTINCSNDATVEDVAAAYMMAWKNKCKGITIYRDGSKSTQVLNTNKPVVGTHQAKPRPKEVPVDIFRTTANGFEWHVIVGKVDDVPYEVFAVNGKQELPPSGRVVKRKRKHYTLYDNNDDILIENIGAEEDEIHPSIALETRRFSLELRHDIDPKYIVEQIDKSNDVVTSFSKAVGRIFKTKYISATALSDVSTPCPDCARNGKSVQMIPEAGCSKCPACHSSRCG